MSSGFEDGFKLTFTAEDESICPYHRHVFTATASYNKTITSPNYPSHSESDLNCNWLLKVDGSIGSDDYIVKVTFSDFAVACDDAVKFYDGNSITVSNLLRSYCGTIYPEVIYSTGRYLFVNFYTDNDLFTYRGFNFSFSAVKKEEASGICRPSDGRNTVNKLSGSSGTFFTPDYPYSYPDDVKCTWTISVPAGKVVKLTFERFHLNRHPDYCNTGNNDYVLIRDGKKKSKVLAEYCGYYEFMGPSDVYSSGSTLSVIFKSVSNSEENSSGFKARFEAVDIQSATSNHLCFSGNVNNNNLKITGLSGTLQSPSRDSSYPPDLSCDWLITVPEGKIVKLSFDVLDLHSSGWGQCKEDYVEVLDGRYNSSLSNGRFCDPTPRDIHSSGRYMRVRFKSDSGNSYFSRRGFKASFTAENGPATPTPANSKELCYTGNINNDNLQLTSTYGTLQSPQKDSKYGKEYPQDSNCVWLITVPAPKIVRLSFDSFDLEWSSGCTADYVEVRDGSTRYSRSKGRFCGLTVPEDVLSTGRYMRVRFRSDSEYSYYSGFKATFTAEDKPSSSPSTAVVLVIILIVTVLIVVVCCVVCFKKRKKRPNREAEVRIPLSTVTTSATHSTQPRVVQHSPHPSRQAPSTPTLQLNPLPPVSYAPVATEPEVPPPAYPYPLESPPPYPGEESGPQYPPPGQSYPWQQTSSSAPVEPSAPPEDPV